MGCHFKYEKNSRKSTLCNSIALLIVPEVHNPCIYWQVFLWTCILLVTETEQAQHIYVYPHLFIAHYKQELISFAHLTWRSTEISDTLSWLKPSCQIRATQPQFSPLPTLVEWGGESKVKPLGWDRNSLITDNKVKKVALERKIAYHPLSSAMAHSKTQDSPPSNSPSLCVGHEIMWCGISLLPVWVTCPGYGLSQFFYFLYLLPIMSMIHKNIFLDLG